MILPPLAAALVASAHEATPSPANGRAIAQGYCAGCHAVGATGASPRAAAPPFRDLHRLYPVESLQESLAEGILAGHPDMPQVVLVPGEIENFIAYLKSLETQPRGLGDRR